MLCGFLLDGYLAHGRAAQLCDALISKAFAGEPLEAVKDYETIPGLVAVYAVRPRAAGTQGAAGLDTTPQSSVMYIVEGPVAVKWTCLARSRNERIESATTERGDVSSYGYYIGQQLEWQR